ncbi:hypothetical protein [Roseovarius aestuariivivens]|uniref:hypothetical protein n=1 Tax=Roseovarius aestuariivivens TaxID=1888910 RepID=UPI001081F56A|nr:hypothetical protein [Roseovarius aestuariivivens]
MTAPADYDDMSKPLFSFLTLVSSHEKYEAMVNSFRSVGFEDPACRFHAIDNTHGNIADGYSALHLLREELDGRYIIFVHDDVEATEDTLDQLVELLQELEQADPRWQIAGNAGFTSLANGKFAFKAHINDPHGEYRLESQTQVESLDENFLVLKNGLRPSADLSGFHLFATDMCILARISGGTAYVIPFLVQHKSAGGTSDALYECLEAFEEKYTGLGLSDTLRAPSTIIFLGKHRNIKRFFFERRSRFERFIDRRKKQIRRKLAS